jgi:hypothetical protein
MSVTIVVEVHLSLLALLAGFFAAHAVWSISDGETLVPMYAYVDTAGSRHMDRLEGETAKSVEVGRKRLEENPDKAKCAVLIFDGYVPLSDGKTDALILEIRSYDGPAMRITMAIPYAPLNSPAGFKVFRPKILQFPVTENSQDFIEEFWRGVDGHSQGAATWNAHLDQTK